MLLQTNSYLVPRARRDAHARLMRRFAACFRRLGSDLEVYEQADGPEFRPRGRDAESTRFVQMMRFRDRDHQRQVRDREQSDAEAKGLIAEFVELVDLARQGREGQYAGSYYLGLDLREPAAPAAAEVPVTVVDETL